MANEIKPGMKFGNYDSMTASLSNKYLFKTFVENRPGLDAKGIRFFDQKNKQCAEAERLYYQDMEKSKYVNHKLVGGWTATSSIHVNDLRYSATNTKEDKTGTVPYPNKFTKIESETQYAVDKNKNGVVDKGEIYNIDVKY